MTTIDAAAAWRVMKPITLAAYAVVLGVGLGGCETASNLFANNETATPIADASAPAATTQTAKIAIASVIGPSESVARSLETQIQTALTKQSVTVARTPTDKAEYTLRGYLVSAREKTGTKISHVWDVTDPSGKRVNRITGEELVPGTQGKDPWAAVTPQLVDQIANKTAGSLATWLPSQPAMGAAPSVPVAQNNAAAAPVATPAVAAATPPPATPAVAAAPQPAPQTVAAKTAAPSAAGAPAPATTASIERSNAVTAMVPSVTGAPGDGSIALTNAIQRELSRSGVALTDRPSGQTYSVEGKVVVGEGRDGKQPISIDWHVKDPTGKKLGTVSQKNEVTQGALDGSWGKTADAAAAAAAQGIVKLLPPQTKAN